MSAHLVLAPQHMSVVAPSAQLLAVSAVWLTVTEVRETLRRNRCPGESTVGNASHPDDRATYRRATELSRSWITWERLGDSTRLTRF